MPAAVFTVGCAVGTENFSINMMLNMLLVTIGIGIASYGEMDFNVLGVAFQLGSIFSESCRLVLVQILLQSRGLKLNPVTTLYYVAPCCFAFLVVPFLILEAPKLVSSPPTGIPAWIFLSNALAAFGLNMAVFLLIGKTSALTMNIAGVVKDWILIFLSAAMFKSVVTQLNLFGYFIAFVAVGWYNYRKLQAMQEVEAPTPTVPDKAGSPDNSSA